MHAAEKETARPATILRHVQLFSGMDSYPIINIEKVGRFIPISAVERLRLSEASEGHQQLVRRGCTQRGAVDGIRDNECMFSLRER